MVKSEEDPQAAEFTAGAKVSPDPFDTDASTVKISEDDKEAQTAEEEAESMTAFLRALFDAGRITRKELQHSENFVANERLEERHRVEERVNRTVSFPGLVTIAHTPGVVNSSQLNATSIVLNRPELFENIYINASGKDLHAALKVCIGFREMLPASPKLRKTMSYIVDAINGTVNIDFEGADFTQNQNSVIRAFDEGLYNRDRECWNAECNFSVCNVYATARCASLTRLQLTDPPTTHAEVSWIDHCTGWHKCWPVVVQNPDGVTIQDVLDKVEAAGKHLAHCKDHVANQKIVFEHLRDTCGHLERIEIAFQTEIKMSAADYHYDYECNEDCDCDAAQELYPELWGHSNGNGTGESSAGLGADDSGDDIEQSSTHDTEEQDEYDQHGSSDEKAGHSL